jgi:hypothetical protein
MAKLIYEATGKEVKEGDILTDFRGDKAVFDSFTEPHKPSSTGKVYTQREGLLYKSESYPSVFGLKIIDHQFSN